MPDPRYSLRRLRRSVGLTKKRRMAGCERNDRMIDYRVMVNGIEVNARYSRQAVEDIFLPLLQRLTALQRERGRRILVLLAAPPGAGKTTLLSFLEKLSREQPDTAPVQVIGMDGFHRRQEDLLSRRTIRNGKEISLVEIKGAPVTFDLEKLTRAVKETAAGGDVRWPAYDRVLHNPVEDAVHVDGDIVLLEGNYLLLDEDGWRDLSALADYTVSVSAKEKLLRDRLIDRRIRTGVSRVEAVRFVDFSDMPNVRLCLEKSLPADLRLCLDESGDYRLMD